MKKSIMSTVAFMIVFFYTAFILNPVSAQTEQKAVTENKPIPPEVTKVIEKSCINCHAEPGSGMALTSVNLSKWDQYTPEKQASKAKAMCNIVSKGKMPKKSFVKKNPDAVPTKDDIKTLCDWAESLAVTKK